MKWSCLSCHCPHRDHCIVCFIFQMAIIFNQEGLKAIQPPCVIQSFISHNAVLYKVFVVGESYTVVKRPSLKNFSAGASGKRCWIAILFVYWKESCWQPAGRREILLSWGAGVPVKSSSSRLPPPLWHASGNSLGTYMKLLCTESDHSSISFSIVYTNWQWLARVSDGTLFPALPTWDILYAKSVHCLSCVPSLA